MFNKGEQTFILFSTIGNFSIENGCLFQNMLKFTQQLSPKSYSRL